MSAYRRSQLPNNLVELIAKLFEISTDAIALHFEGLAIFCSGSLEPKHDHVEIPCDLGKLKGVWARRHV